MSSSSDDIVASTTREKEPADDAQTSNETSSSSSPPVDPTAVTFVDYRRPPVAKVQPPSKYKLWTLVFVLVYFAVWVGELANLYQALHLNGWLSPQGAQFVQLALVVFVMTYGALDFTVGMFTVRICGHAYGLGPWLQSERIQWIHKTLYSDYFVLECLKCAIVILEDGFGMFNASKPALAPSHRHKTAHQHERTRNTSRSRKRQRQQMHSSQTEEDEVTSYSDEDDDDGETRQFRCDSDNCQTILKIEHRINPEKMAEYEKWQKRITRAGKYAPGLLSIRRMDIVEEEVTQDKNGKNDNDIEQGDNQLSSTAKQSALSIASKYGRRMTFRRSSSVNSTACKSNLHTIFLTFDNIDSLNDWMMSPRRKALIKQLEPLLVVPDQEMIEAKRAANARDAFTNLLIQQGSYSPTIAPKKWKVWWLTTLGLLITVRWVDTFLGYYLEFWGLNDKHPRVAALVSIFITTFLTSYVLIPFLLFLFNPWIVRMPNEVDDRLVWKTLDDGIESFWVKGLLTFAFYGGCIIAWLVHDK
mmetsp:Transcript_20772/g.38813  ORF Transcript_20772/g.38813 Transcript_20772/m.38813 type:complete len:529 (+) Transcript_20772:395-1981(+)|eukprot:CAMPEP_0178756622 /NCGR_PEP_ID=MMETSP0744-20121128/13381_1 /TAXON_ID=913974 /ORGANISM="Nitzschia punctata, Strain CCMP561" /LENGTH=528 /DNA_ID=CAMNT_0020410793 /DNA_START=345 /DNA_END=1931 /DNA_ORIENTATION=+